MNGPITRRSALGAAPADLIGAVACQMIDALSSVMDLHGDAFVEAGWLAFINVARAAHAEHGAEAGRDIVGEAIRQVWAAYQEVTR
jgi:hypothetical protein